MSDPNIHTPEWEVDYRDTPVAMRGVRLATAAGAQQLGASLYEVMPGGAVAPYHLHHGNEEHFPEVAEHVTTGTTMAMTRPAEGKIFSAGSDEDFLALPARDRGRRRAGWLGVLNRRS